MHRAEDTAAAQHLGATAKCGLDLPEAPHRGYHSPASLFADALPTDDVVEDFMPLLTL